MTTFICLCILDYIFNHHLKLFGNETLGRIDLATWGRNDLGRNDLGAKRLGAKRLGGKTTWGRNDLYSSKRHTNHHVSFRHPVYTYGIILGLLNFKPSCGCSLEISQYCQCSLYSVIIVKAMEASRKVLFRDVDFNISSKFIIEVNETNNVIALYPSQIERKCVCLTLESKTYFCPLPYRIYGD